MSADRLDFPEEFPGAWSKWPAPLKHYLTFRVMQRMVDIHGPVDLVNWAYAGTYRPNGERVPFVTNGAEYYPFLLEDARAWLAALEAKRAQPRTPTSEDSAP